MAGFRAAGWTCFAAASLAVLISVVGLWGTGIVGAPPKAGGAGLETGASSAIELSDVKREEVAVASGSV